MSEKIRFWNENPEIAQHFPIVEAKKIMPEWVKKMGKINLTEYNSPDAQSTLKKCPGIVDYLGAGFILTTWADLCIETDFRSGQILVSNVFNKNSPLKMFSLGHDFMRPELWGDAPPMIGNTNNMVMKIKTGWNVQLPENCDMLFLPCTYFFNPDISACPGILNTQHVENIFVQMFCHPQDKKVHVPAGTPLVQMIPLTQRVNVGYEIIMDKDEIENIHKKRQKDKIERTHSQQRPYAYRDIDTKYATNPGLGKYTVFNEKFFDYSIDKEWDEKEKEMKCPFHTDK